MHGDNGDGVDLAEFGLERCKGDYNAYDCAIGIADKEALFELKVGALVRDQVEMGEVDSRDNERDERVAAVVFGVGEGGNVGFEKGHFWGDISNDFRRWKPGAVYQYLQQHRCPSQRRQYRLRP